MTAVVRSEDRLADVCHSNLNTYAGDVRDPSFLKQLVPGHDAVISTLGPRRPTKSACAIYPESALAVVEAMETCGVKRLLVTSTALLFPSRRWLHRALRLIARHNVRYAERMEQIILASSLDWTITRVGFLNNSGSINYQLSADEGGPISRKAVARFLLDEARASNHVQQVLGLTA